MEKKTDGGHEIPEEDLREMEQDGGQEVTEETKTQTGYCKFCGQSGIIYAPKTWSQEEVNEAATCRCESVTKPRGMQKAKSVCKRQRTVLRNYLAVMRKDP